MKIRIGSRDSRLAVIQSEMVIDSIRAYDPTAEVELVTMKIGRASCRERV